MGLGTVQIRRTREAGRDGLHQGLPGLPPPGELDRLDLHPGLSRPLFEVGGTNRRRADEEVSVGKHNWSRVGRSEPGRRQDEGGCCSAARGVTDCLRCPGEAEGAGPEGLSEMGLSRRPYDAKWTQ